MRSANLHFRAETNSFLQDAISNIYVVMCGANIACESSALDTLDFHVLITTQYTFKFQVPAYAPTYVNYFKDIRILVIISIAL